MFEFVSPNTPARAQLFIISVILDAYDVADVMGDNNYATLLDSFVSTSSLQVAQIHTKKVSGLNHLVLDKKWGILPKKHLIRFAIPHNMVSALCCICPCLVHLGQLIVSYSTEDYCIMCTVIHCLPLSV